MYSLVSLLSGKCTYSNAEDKQLFIVDTIDNSNMNNGNALNDKQIN